MRPLINEWAQPNTNVKGVKMSKFKIKMKLQGFELEIEGSREDVPLITQNLAEQFAGLIKPSAAILEGEVLSNSGQTASIGIQQSASQVPKKRAKRTLTVKADSSTNGQSVIDWKHNSEKYGMPNQNWSASNKYLWTLYVIGEETSTKEVPAITIANTFNKHFKQFGALIVNNAKRDMGTLKTKKPSLASEDTTQTPSAWYLTESGSKAAQKLIAESLGTE